MPRKKAKRSLKNVLDQLESTTYSSTLQSDEESTPQKKKKVCDFRNTRNRR